MPTAEGMVQSDGCPYFIVLAKRHRNPLQDINVAIIRPSKLKDMQRIVIQENLNAIKVREAELRDMVEKLTTWFTYFGASHN